MSSHICNLLQWSKNLVVILASSNFNCISVPYGKIRLFIFYFCFVDEKGIQAPLCLSLCLSLHVMLKNLLGPSILFFFFLSISASIPSVPEYKVNRINESYSKFTCHIRIYLCSIATGLIAIFKLFSHVNSYA